jgi:hypothetical protein
MQCHSAARDESRWLSRKLRDCPRPDAVGDEWQLYRCIRSANFLALSTRADRAAKYSGSCSKARVDSPTAFGSHFERMSPI